MLTEGPTETLLLQYSAHSFYLLLGGRFPKHYIQRHSNSIKSTAAAVVAVVVVAVVVV